MRRNHSPRLLDWSWPELPSTDFHSHNISGCQRLPNGNTLICEGNKGRLFEINPDGDIVWEYRTAYNQFGPINQGDSPMNNATFRAYRYGPDYPAFLGRDMTPGDPVESNPWPFDCELFPAPMDTTTHGVSIEDLHLSIGPNPARSVLSVHADRPFCWSLHDMTGRPLLTGSEPRVAHTIETLNLPPGLLLLQVTDQFGHSLVAPQRILVEN